MITTDFTVLSVLDIRRKMTEAHIPEEGRRIDLSPGALYSLCTDLEDRGFAVRQSDAEDLLKCKLALSWGKWGAARAAMPRQLYGMQINLLTFSDKERP